VTFRLVDADGVPVDLDDPRRDMPAGVTLDALDCRGTAVDLWAECHGILDHVWRNLQHQLG
jgi:hypothetical protein